MLDDDGVLRFIAPAPRLGPAPGTAGDAWRAEVGRIEERGFDILAVSEHYTRGWTLEPLTALSFAVASTTRLEVLPLVLNNDLRHPAMLAKAIATADVLSGGRVMLGLGAGWLRADYDALGFAFDPAGVRLERFAEALTVVRLFFDRAVVDHDGWHYSITELEALPATTRVGGPPILVGGGGPRVLSLAGRTADIVGVHVTLHETGFDARAARELSLKQITHKIEIVNRAAAEAGRRPPMIQFTPAVVVIDGEQSTADRPGFTDYIAAHPQEFAESPAVLIGDASEVAAQIRRWRDELGIGLWHLGGNVNAVGQVIHAVHHV